MSLLGARREEKHTPSASGTHLLFNHCTCCQWTQIDFAGHPAAPKQAPSTPLLYLQSTSTAGSYPSLAGSCTAETKVFSSQLLPPWGFASYSSLLSEQLSWNSLFLLSGLPWQFSHALWDWWGFLSYLQFFSILFKRWLFSGTWNFLVIQC